MIRQLAKDYPVISLCAALRVSRSAYYTWLKASSAQRSDEELRSQIRTIYKTHLRRYGSPRVHAELQADGKRCSRKRVAKLMREEGLRALPLKRYTVTTQSIEGRPAAPNLLARDFRPGGAPRWVADITYVSTGEGNLYLAAVLNLANREVIGFSMDRDMTVQLTLDALRMAIERGRKRPRLHHSDRGGQYTANSYTAMLRGHGIEVSNSERANCYDNAVMESFFAGMKREAIYPDPPKTRAQARRLIFEYIEFYYNRVRRHSSLGYLSPMSYETCNNVSIPTVRGMG